MAALTAASRVEPAIYLPALKEYAAALRSYRTNRNGVVGSDVLPAPKPPDRYYDDNAWVALGMVEAYQQTHDAADLAFSEESLAFCLSGEDAKLGGGIYWHEDRYEKKHACSSAPSAAAALELYRVTHNQRYLETGRRLYNWTRSRLQDSDGLYSDSIALADGKVDRAKYAYNTALMIRSAFLLYEITHDATYLKEAQRVASAAEQHWVRPADGAIRAESKFAHKLAESFLSVYDADHDRHWLDVVRRSLQYLHEHCRDPMGWYADRWDAHDPPVLDPVHLVDQASAARAYWVAARYDLAP